MPSIALDNIFADHRVMIILRGMSSAAKAVEIANRAWDSGVELLEMTIGQIADAEALAAVVDAGRERGKRVGAGTIVTPDHVRAAQEAGARYTVAPGFTPTVLESSQAIGLPHVPGVATPSEVQRAWTYGCRWVKVFPACTLGPAWFSALRGPFPDVNYLATGGVTIEAAPDYIAAGARLVAFGASAVTPERRGDLAALINELR